MYIYICISLIHHTALIAMGCQTSHLAPLMTNVLKRLFELLNVAVSRIFEKVISNDIDLEFVILVLPPFLHMGVYNQILRVFQDRYPIVMRDYTHD